MFNWDKYCSVYMWSLYPKMFFENLCYWSVVHCSNNLSNIVTTINDSFSFRANMLSGSQGLLFTIKRKKQIDSISANVNANTRLWIWETQLYRIPITVVGNVNNLYAGFSFKDIEKTFNLYLADKKHYRDLRTILPI